MNLKINDAGYYELNTATVSDTQGNLTHNPEIVTHTSNGKFEQKLLSYRTIPVLPLSTDPGIDQWIAVIKLIPQTLLMPETKKIVVNPTSGGRWTSMTAWRVSITGVNESTPGGIVNTIDNFETSSPVMIENIGTAPPCGFNWSQEFGYKRKSTSSGLVRQSQKLNASVDRKYSNNRNSTSILSKLFSQKIFDGPI